MFTAHGCLRLRGVSSCHRIFCLFHCLQHHLCTAERKHARSSACTHVCKRTRTHAYTHICTHSCTLACKRASNQIKRCLQFLHLQFYTCNFTSAILHLHFCTCNFTPAPCTSTCMEERQCIPAFLCTCRLPNTQKRRRSTQLKACLWTNRQGLIVYKALVYFNHAAYA